MPNLMCKEVDGVFESAYKVYITGSALARHCCKAHTRINRKMGNSTPCKIVTPENFVQKFAHVITSGTATTVQISVKIGSVGTSSQVGEI